jgi:hypothetical protein
VRRCVPGFVALVLLFVSVIGVRPALAGPPFRTDDPEPVEHKHWEFYTATQYENDGGDLSGTAPSFEVNYGIAPDVQLHLILPSAYSRPKEGPTLFGLGNVELGVKYRFVQESDYVPMIGSFPLLEAPTGSESRGLGTGHPQLFVPLWLQKSLGPWTAYGGGGYWINPGAGNRNYWFTGIVVQGDVAKWLTLGGEVFHLTPSTVDATNETGYNFGGQVNFTDKHHFIWSVGTDIKGPANFFCYAAYLITWGPPGEKKDAREGQ